MMKESAKKLEKSAFVLSEISDEREIPLPLGGPEKVAWMLRHNRLQAGLSQAQVLQKTKIHHKVLEDLEAGAFHRMPSPAHARAFILAVTRACGGDEKAILEAWREAGSPTGAGSAPAPKETVPPPAPEEQAVAAPSLRIAVAQAPSSSAVQPVPEPRIERSRPVEGRSGGGLKPWLGWIVVALAAAGILWFVSRVAHRHPAMELDGQPSVAAIPAEAMPPSKPADEAKAPAAADQADAPEVSVAENPSASAGRGTSAAETAADSEGELYLRARRDCWVQVKVDGKLQPVEKLARNQKKFWRAKDKIVLLAGDAGAVKVGWEGVSLGYLGGTQRAPQWPGVRAGQEIFPGPARGPAPA
jgi:cytoskeleton protein RodZ